MTITGKMTGATLPGNSTVAFKEYDIPAPGHGEVLIRTKSSTICGSDIRAIYREHLGKGPEGYQGVIAGHEPCGQINRCAGGGFPSGRRRNIWRWRRPVKAVSSMTACGCFGARMAFMYSSERTDDRRRE